MVTPNHAERGETGWLPVGLSFFFLKYCHIQHTAVKNSKKESQVVGAC